jgi:hypothetical protein
MQDLEDDAKRDKEAEKTAIKKESSQQKPPAASDSAVGRHTRSHDAASLHALESLVYGAVVPPTQFMARAVVIKIELIL